MRAEAVTTQGRTGRRFPSRTFGVLGLGRVKLFCLGFLRGAVGKDRIRFFSSSSSRGAFGKVLILGSVECSVENASYSSSSMPNVTIEPTDRGASDRDAGGAAAKKKWQFQRFFLDF